MLFIIYFEYVRTQEPKIPPQAYARNPTIPPSFDARRFYINIDTSQFDENVLYTLITINFGHLNFGYLNFEH